MSVPIPDEVVDAIRCARSVVVMTGAGVSAESGIPTFREDLTGFWANYDPQELATPEGFARDPEMVTRWYDHRRANIAECEPNPGHTAIAELERWITETKDGSFTLLTQNIDGLHRDAGSCHIVELHGSIWRWRCTKTGREREYREFPFSEYPPKSEHGGFLRPAVVWFGEMLPPDAVAEAERASLMCDLFLSIGTSSLVYPAAGFVELAWSSGATTIEINRDPTPISSIVDWSIRGLSGEVMPEVMRCVVGMDM